jgi:hypothetical protein
MSGKTKKPERWDPLVEGKILVDLFLKHKNGDKEGGVDYNNQEPAYIRQVKTKHPKFARFTDKNFRETYKRYASNQGISDTLKGARRNKKKQKKAAGTCCRPSFQFIFTYSRFLLFIYS